MSLINLENFFNAVLNENFLNNLFKTDVKKRLKIFKITKKHQFIDFSLKK